MRHINRYPQKGMRLTLMLLPFCRADRRLVYWIGGAAGSQSAGQVAARPVADGGSH